MPYIEGITVCIGFGDYLAETMPQNRSQVDRMIVVTESEDKLTRRIAKAAGCRIVLTKRHRGGRNTFNKGRVVNDGIRAAHGRDWLLHLDADIALPAGFRFNLECFLRSEKIRLAKNPIRVAHAPPMTIDTVIYGTQRSHCPSYADWRDYLETGETDDRWTLDTLVGGNERRSGNAPAGYFQLWHGSAEKFYPEDYNRAGGSDGAFSRQFLHRVYLPMPVFHLGLHGRPTTDHRGRKSEPWGWLVPTI